MNGTTAKKQSQSIAHTVKKQIGFLPLASIGARDFIATGHGLAFTAKPTTRKYMIDVRLNGLDYYDITATKLSGKMERVEIATDVDCEALAAVILSLEEKI